MCLWVRAEHSGSLSLLLGKIHLSVFKSNFFNGNFCTERNLGPWISFCKVQSENTCLDSQICFFFSVKMHQFFCPSVHGRVVKQNFEYSQSKAALCFFCLLTNIKPGKSSNTKPSVQILTRWAGCFRRCDRSDLRLRAVLWSTAGQKYVQIFCFSSQDLVIGDNGSGWIYTDPQGSGWSRIILNDQDLSLCRRFKNVILSSFEFWKTGILNCHD